MNVRKSLTTLALGAALVAPATLATASPAAAQDSYARVRIDASTTYPGYYNVTVYGHVNGAPASSIIATRLKGDDPWSDDELGGYATTTAYYGDFSTRVLMHGSALNEDWPDCDEIFAVVTSSTGWKTNTPNVNMCF